MTELFIGAPPKQEAIRTTGKVKSPSADRALRQLLTPPEARRPQADLIALLSGAALKDRLRRSPEDSEELTHLVTENWQIIAAFDDEQMAQLGEALSPKDYARLERVRLAVIAFAKTQEAASRTFIAEVAACGLDYALLKGSAMGLVAYDKGWMRAGWDLDIGVAPSKVREMEAIALRCGFHSAQQDPVSGVFFVADPALKAKVEREHYELGFLVRRLRVANLDPLTREAIRTEPLAHRFWFNPDGGEPYCYASLDIHHAIAHGVRIEDLLATSIQLNRDGQAVRVPSLSWMAAHAIFKIYWEGVHNYRKGVYQYADLARLFPRLDADDFHETVEILRRHDLLCAGLYVVRRLPLFGVELTTSMRAFVAENEVAPRGRDPVSINDLGDMWPKLWGLR